MSDAYNMLLIRVVQGTASLATAFWVTLAIMGGYFAYQHYMPLITDVYRIRFRVVDVCIITYALISIHHCAQGASLFPRLLARTYVIFLLMAADYIMFKHYGLAWAVGYPFIAVAAEFIVKE